MRLETNEGFKMKIGDLVKTSLWGNGLVLDLKVLTLQPGGDMVVASVLVERVVQNTHVRRITGENLEVINAAG